MHHTALDPRVHHFPTGDRRRPDVPPDLAAALRSNRDAAEAFDRLTFSGRRELVDWIEAAGWTPYRRGRVKRVLLRLGARGHRRDRAAS